MLNLSVSGFDRLFSSGALRLPGSRITIQGFICWITTDVFFQTAEK